MGSDRGHGSADDDERLEREITATEDLLEQLIHGPPSPKTDLAIVLLHRVLDKVKDSPGAAREYPERLPRG
jgi:hypothetical protein